MITAEMYKKVARYKNFFRQKTKFANDTHSLTPQRPISTEASEFSCGDSLSGSCIIGNWKYINFLNKS